MEPSLQCLSVHCGNRYLSRKFLDPVIRPVSPGCHGLEGRHGAWAGVQGCREEASQKTSGVGDTELSLQKSGSWACQWSNVFSINHLKKNKWMRISTYEMIHIMLKLSKLNTKDRITPQVCWYLPCQKQRQNHWKVCVVTYLQIR